MITKTNSACNTLDGKMFDFMKGVNVDFSWVNEALDKINDEITKINNKIDSMFPSGVIVKYTNSPSSEKVIFNTPTLIRGWMKDRSKQTNIPSFLTSLGANWSLIGIYGTFEYEDLVGDTVTFKHKVTFMGNKIEDYVRICYFAYQNATGEEGTDATADDTPNARQYGTQIGDWEILLSQNNYSIDYVRTASGNNETYEGSQPGFSLWVAGANEAEWGINKANGEQTWLEWFTYAPDHIGSSGYTATVVLTVKDITKINPECFAEMEYLEYRKD